MATVIARSNHLWAILARLDVVLRIDTHGSGTRQTEKLVPQPQDELAFGLFTLKAAPMRSST